MRAFTKPHPGCHPLFLICAPRTSLSLSRVEHGFKIAQAVPYSTRLDRGSSQRQTAVLQSMCGGGNQAASCHETTPNRHRKDGQRHLVYARQGWLQSPFGKNAYRLLLRLKQPPRGSCLGQNLNINGFIGGAEITGAETRDCLSMGFDQDFTIGIITLGSCHNLVKLCGFCAACSERGVIGRLVNHQKKICYRGLGCGFKRIML